MNFFEDVTSSTEFIISQLLTYPCFMGIGVSGIVLAYLGNIGSVGSASYIVRRVALFSGVFFQIWSVYRKFATKLQTRWYCFLALMASLFHVAAHYNQNTRYSLPYVWLDIVVTHPVIIYVTLQLAIKECQETNISPSAHITIARVAYIFNALSILVI